MVFLGIGYIHQNGYKNWEKLTRVEEIYMSRGQRDGRKYWINFRSFGIPFIQLIFVDVDNGNSFETGNVANFHCTEQIFFLFLSSVLLENSRANRYHQTQSKRSQS